MGAVSSKPQTFVISNDESLNIPIQFNQKFIDSLLPHKVEKPQPNQNIQELVETELDKQRQLRIIQESRLQKQALKETEEILERIEKLPKLKISSLVEQKQNDLIMCYSNKPDSVLDCYKEVQAFKLAEQAALDNFVQSQ